jgi:hypothetical protein
MLGERQQAMLRAVARDPKDPLFGKPNELLNLAIERIMLEQPNAFLEERDFKKRSFYHKPRHAETLYKSYIEE